MRGSALLASHVDVVCGGSVHGCGCGHCQCTWVWVWPLSVYMGVGVAAVSVQYMGVGVATVSVHGCGCGRCQCTWVWVWPLSVYMGVGVAAVSVHGCGCGRCQCTWVCVWPLSVYMGVGVGAVGVLCLLQTQVLNWWEGPVHMRDVSKSTTMAPGGLCAVMAGTCVMPQWSVVNWATSRQKQLSWGLHGLVQAEVPSCSVNCPALATRASSLSVVMTTVVDTTAATMKMSALCVVSQCVCGGSGVRGGGGGDIICILCVCICVYWPHKTQWLHDCKRNTFCLSPGPLVSIRCCAQRAGGLTALTTADQQRQPSLGKHA